MNPAYMKTRSGWGPSLRLAALAVALGIPIGVLLGLWWSREKPDLPGWRP